MLLFNAEHGYVEGLIRGLRVGLLNSQNYANLTQCETLGPHPPARPRGNPSTRAFLTRVPEDLKLQLSATEYGNFLANVPSPVSTSIISDKATEKLVHEFNYLRAQAVGDFAKFFDYITYSYQIDNVVLLITGTLHERDTHELLERCHPLGWFNALPALCVATTVEELYNSVLIETPLGIRLGRSAFRIFGLTLSVFSPLFQRLPISSRIRRTQHRNHKKHPLQSLPRRLPKLHPTTPQPDLNNHVRNPSL